jgi:hypothetical protein
MYHASRMRTAGSPCKLAEAAQTDVGRAAPGACSSSTAVVCDGIMHALACRGKGAARRANRDRAHCRRSGGVLTEMVVVQALAPRTFTARATTRITTA